MVHVLDPSLPRVWRSPDELQFGVDDPRLVLTPVAEWEERMIGALASGVPLSVLQAIGERAGAPDGAARSLLERLAPVLQPSDAAASDEAAVPAVVVDGEGPTASLIAGLLGEEGVSVVSGREWSDPLVETADAAVIVASYAVEPRRYEGWLRRDVPHLPVVFGDGGVTVGPLVEPGAGPCLRCVDLHRTDDDPAWPAMAAQLYRRPRPGESALASATIASTAVVAVVSRLRDGDTALTARSTRVVPRSGERTAVSWTPHSACGCRALPGPVLEAPRGTGTAGA
ncbi:hypothetical protein [Leifsonia sp. AG29]|uniref:hypothetical protein n=1 Tax=Leifsonia sp. AG29 TaxID=2598860 RepID=UPI00131A7EA4|nr:hypothetical protein [Leifsonia sp. AG29]